MKKAINFIKNKHTLFTISHILMLISPFPVLFGLTASCHIIWGVVDYCVPSCNIRSKITKF